MTPCHRLRTPSLRRPPSRRTSGGPWSLALPGVALAALAVLGVAAQEDQGEAAPERLYFDRLEVSVVNVEVMVTDKQGNVVQGLDRDDFEIWEDGLEQEISHFYAVEDGRVRGLPDAPSPPAADDEPDLPPRRFQEVPEDQALRLVVFFDNVFMRPTNRNKVIRQVDDFLRRTIRPEADQVMVVTFDRGIHIRQPFTNDLARVDQALAEAELAAGFAMRTGTERRDVIQRLDRARDVYEAEGFVNFYAQERFYNVRQSIEGLREIISSMAGLPGRKALLYVSDGIPMTAAEDLFHLLDIKFGNEFPSAIMANQFRSRHAFRELTNQANANGVTFYTLEAAGLRSHTTLSAEYGQLGDTVSFVEIDTVHDMSLEEPLMVMADATGGLAMLNTNDLDGALAGVTNDFRNYYSLGYTPRHAETGRYHKIEVKVKGRGLKVRHRTGYRDKSPATRVYEGTLATLLYGAQKNPLEVEVTIPSTGRLDDDGQRLVPVEVRIPIGRLSLVPRETLHRGQLQVAVALIDDQGRMSPLTQNEVPLEVPNGDLEMARKSYYTYAVELKMRPRGSHQIAIGVHDELSGETSFLRQSVRLEP